METGYEMNNPNPYEVAGQYIAEWFRDAGHNAAPSFVALTSALLEDGTEVVIPLGPPRASWAEAAIDGYGKRATIALVMRQAGKGNDGDKPDNDAKPNAPEPESESRRELAIVH
jgi:hypothetical protein